MNDQYGPWEESDSDSSVLTTNYPIMIMLIDDQAMVGEAMRRLLANEPDMALHYCSDASVCLEQACQIRPTVILLDLVMPQIDGLEVLRLLRSNPATTNIPIVVLSTTEDPQTKSDAFAAGANDYLVKLPSTVELIARVRYHSRSYVNLLQRDAAHRALRKSQEQLMESNTALTELNDAILIAKAEAERANAAKSEFLSRMSHELRTPLNAILGFGQLLEMDDLTDRHRQCVEQILGGGRHLLDLINEVLDIARIESGRMTLSREPIAVRDVLMEAIDLVRPLASTRRVSIQCHKEGGSRTSVIYVQADRQRLKQILINLLSNAIKYNRDHGDVTLSYRLINPSQSSLSKRGEVGERRASSDRRSVDNRRQSLERRGVLERREILDRRALLDRRKRTTRQEGEDTPGRQNIMTQQKEHDRQGPVVREEDIDLQEAIERRRAGARVRIQVTDTGPGISAAKLERLFVPFDRLGAEQTRIEGTGLGLALSRRLVEAMDGRMDVTSEEGCGSTFWFELPLAENPLETNPTVEDLDPVPGNGSTSRTILYIEDNLSNLRLIEHLIARRSGINLLTAMQGSQGLELAIQNRPDLILLDLHLPDIPGHDVLLRLRAEPATRDIPVVVLSADATLGQIQRLKDAGAFDYLSKPLNLRKFLRVLDETVSR